MKYIAARSTRRGTSMVELLVVIVIFLIGILAVVQVFPGGFNLLRTSRSNAVATQLIRAEVERLRGRADTLPDNVVPTTYVRSGGVVNIVADPDRSPSELAPAGVQVNQDGTVMNAAGDNIGSWQYVSGANVSRRIIGEGGPVPAPRPVGSLYGGLAILQFAPIVVNNDPLYRSVFVAYGADLTRRWGPPGGRPRPWIYFVDNPEDGSAELYLPRDTTLNRQYVLNMTALVDNGSSVERRELIDLIVPVPANVAGGYEVIPLSTLVAGNFIGADFDTIRVARMYQQVGSFSGDPYEYMMLDDTLGLLLVNPVAFTAKETRGNGVRMPLTLKVNYDVYDWRIIRDEFRIPDNEAPRQKLILGNLYMFDRFMPDGKRWSGLNIFTPPGNTQQRDFLVLDLDTGGIVDRASYQVDTTSGIITFLDLDADPSNGTQINLRYPGALNDTVVDAGGRMVRCLYEGANEWSVQMYKAAARYRQTIGRPSIGQYYPAGADAYYNGGGGLGGEVATRIYFPPMDDGKKVTVGEIWYGQAGQEPQMLADQDFLIRSVPADPTGLPYIDIADVLGGAAQPLNYTRYGYAVKNVKGASLTVRALWNPATFTLGTDPDDNLRIFERWMQNWRRSASTTFLVKEAE